jgi:hypothetical protein
MLLTDPSIILVVVGAVKAEAGGMEFLIGGIIWIGGGRLKKEWMHTVDEILADIEVADTSG